MFLHLIVSQYLPNGFAAVLVIDRLAAFASSLGGRDE